VRLVNYSLALLEIRYLLAGVLMNFDIEIPPETNSETMGDAEFGFNYPKAKQMRLRFKPRR
jgi:hypothetical protein